MNKFENSLGRFGSKIASANSKESDGIGVGPVTQQVVKA